MKNKVYLEGDEQIRISKALETVVVKGKDSIVDLQKVIQQCAPVDLTLPQSTFPLEDPGHKFGIDV